MSISKMAEAARLARSKRNELRERELQAQSLAAPGPAKSEPGKSNMPLAPPVNNKLLAGQMAHEFLTRGTLLGRRMKPSHGGPGPVAAPVADTEDELAAKRKYTEVSQLLMSSKSGTHIPGIVNPTQLARWLQIKESPPAGHPSPDKEDPARLSG